MTLDQILDSIKAWNDHRNPQGESVINNYFSEGNCFLYDPEDFSTAKTNCLHVYLGIFNESIKVFLIPADKTTLTIMILLKEYCLISRHVH